MIVSIDTSPCEPPTLVPTIPNHTPTIVKMPQPLRARGFASNAVYASVSSLPVQCSAVRLSTKHACPGPVPSIPCYSSSSTLMGTANVLPRHKKPRCLGVVCSDSSETWSGTNLAGERPTHRFAKLPTSSPSTASLRALCHAAVCRAFVDYPESSSADAHASAFPSRWSSH